MGKHRFRIVVAVTATWSLALGGTALAVPDRAEARAEAEQLPSGGQVSAVVSIGEGQGGGSPTGPGPETAGGTTASQGLVVYVWISTGIGCPYGEAQGRPVDGSPDGVIYEQVRIDRRTDPPTETRLYGECFDAANAPNTPPPPPPPPTLREMSALAQELIIVPDVRVSPDPEVGGVTGLETWFWYEGQDEVTATAAIRGYSVTATMRPSRYYWDPDDPRGVILESDRPGSEEEPAARWVYETKGDYRVRVQVVWDGTWSFTGFGAAANGDLPTIRATGATDYRVDEVRSDLTRTR